MPNHEVLPMSLVEPSTIVAGDYLNWVREYDSVYYIDKDGETQYLSSTDSTLVYILRNKDNRIELTAASTDKDYEITVNSTATQGWQPGIYYWSAVVYHTTGVSERKWEMDRGTVNVLESFSNAAMIEYDGRSHVKKVLDALESAIEGRASKETLDWISYSIAGRSRATDPRELRLWYGQYKWLYNKELSELDPSRAKNTGTILVEI